MSKLPLIPADVKSLEVVTNPHDLRHDLHRFVQYVSTRDVKRAYRTNDLPPADFKRLAQLMKLSEAEMEAPYYGYASEAQSWVDYVDAVALKMGFVTYDTKGTYRGYSSAEPSFPDNFIIFKYDNYQKFLNLSLIEQERRLSDTLVSNYESSKNEFYQRSPLGRLDRFNNFGSGIGVMPTLNFGNIRRYLFDLLAKCEAGEWYSTASLIAYLKITEPYFLIPQNPKLESRWRKEGRYSNFYEGRYQSRDPIPDDAEQGFEWVEGRYIERFLEGIPLTLDYIEVAYSPQGPAEEVFPSRGQLQAFQLTSRFLQAQQGNIPQPKVVVQPNFEIFVESALYPAGLVNRLALFADLVKEDNATLSLKLQRQKVAAQAAEDSNFDVIATLQTLTGKPLPQNVAYELREWTRQAEVFTLYDGFGLLETAHDTLAAEPFTVQKISDSLRLIQHPEEVRTQLRAAEEIVLYIRHENTRLEPLPDKAQTVFPKRTAIKAVKEKPKKQALTIKQEALVALYFPSDETFDKFRKALLDAKCALVADKEKRILTLASSYDPQIKQVIRDLSNEYETKIEKINS